VWVGGLEVGAPHLREIRRRVGIVFQDPDDQLFMSTVREDVAFGPANLGWRDAKLDAAVEGALAAVGLRELAHRPPQQLSFGERRRAALATVLAMQPELLVLDEPTSNLDAGGRRALADVLASLDTTLLLITHDLPYALQLCRRALEMNEGRIVADAPILECLCDAELLAANHLELPLGFFPELARRS
jgi:cobalt/nickel transport system ATP-binding protein